MRADDVMHRIALYKQRHELSIHFFVFFFFSKIFIIPIPDLELYCQVTATSKPFFSGRCVQLMTLKASI